MYAMPLSISADASSACLALSLTSSVSGTSGRTARTSSAGDVPSFAAIEMRVELALAVEHAPARSRRSQTAMLPKPSESTSP